MTRLAMVESLFYFARLVTLRHYDRLSFTGREIYKQGFPPFLLRELGRVS